MGIGENIRKLREAAGLTQQDFANIFGVSYATVSMWESGKRSPEMGTAQKIADHFYVKLDDFIKGDVSGSVNRIITDFERLQIVCSQLPPEKVKTALKILEAIRDEA